MDVVVLLTVSKVVCILDLATGCDQADIIIYKPINMFKHTVNFIH